MRKTLCIVVCVLLASLALSQIYATTQDGRQVILYPDGRWVWASSPSPSPSPVSDLSGTWDFSWKLGVFDEEIQVEIRQFAHSLTLIWRIHVYEDTIEVPWQPGQDIQFVGRSFFHGMITFKGRIENDRTISGVVTSEGAFPKTGTFKATRR